MSDHNRLTFFVGLGFPVEALGIGVPLARGKIYFLIMP
jgi:hypothetical protein